MRPIWSATSWAVSMISQRTSAISSRDRYDSVRLIRGVNAGFAGCCISKEEMQMNKLMIAFAATMALASFGCKKKAGTGGSGEAMAKMTEFKDKMCACKDAE